jgi:hypothetical protein
MRFQPQNTDFSPSYRTFLFAERKGSIRAIFYPCYGSKLYKYLKKNGSTDKIAGLE